MLYDQAVADPATAEVIGFVDLSRVWKALGSGALDTPSQKEAVSLAAIGLTGRHSGGDSSFTLRVVLR